MITVATGTELVKDVFPGTGGSAPVPPLGPYSEESLDRPTPYAALGDVLLFAANDGAHGLELWRSDGTTDGTWMVLDVPEDLKGSGLRCLTAADDLLFFFAGSTYAGAELWRSDGTPEGTFPVKKTEPCWRDSALVPLGKSVCFFGADGGSDFGLWRS